VLWGKEFTINTPAVTHHLFDNWGDDHTEILTQTAFKQQLETKILVFDHDGGRGEIRAHASYFRNAHWVRILIKK